MIKLPAFKCCQYATYRIEGLGFVGANLTCNLHRESSKSKQTWSENHPEETKQDQIPAYIFFWKDVAMNMIEVRENPTDIDGFI